MYGSLNRTSGDQENLPSIWNDICVGLQVVARVQECDDVRDHRLVKPSWVSDNTLSIRLTDTSRLSSPLAVNMNLEFD